MTSKRSALHHVQPAFLSRSAGCILVGVAVAVSGCGDVRSIASHGQGASAVGEGGLKLDPEVSAFYLSRNYQPLWWAGARLKPEATIAVAMLRGAAAHGLDPSAYDLPGIEDAVSRSGGGGRSDLIRADMLLSQAYSRFAQDIRRPSRAGPVFYVDGNLQPRTPSRREVLDELTNAPSMSAQLRATERLNPIYDGLHQAMSTALRDGASPTELSVLRLNLERARLLPTNQAGPHLVVDAASAQLWMVDHGRIADGMRVIVGKPSQPTPMMAGLIRFAVLNPYWHIPPDLVPTRVGMKVLREGPDALRQDRLEIVSDWGANGRTIDPSEVNWPAVVAGRERLRVRQLPGSANMMGSIKFMMPNRLGIYLHDTPNKSFFALNDRRLSSGCVRVEDSARLARWVFGGKAPVPSGAAEERADLPWPIPVYITYLTAGAGTDGRPMFRPDVYGRDRASLMALAERAHT